MQCKNSYVVICLHPQCANTKWSKWYGRRPFYSFNKYHHRKVHQHQPYKVQIVSRLYMSTYKYIKEYRLVYTKPTIGQIMLMPQKPTTYYLSWHQRNTKITNMIFNVFLGKYVCKRLLDVYYVRELISWAAENPKYKISHRYLFKDTSPEFQASYDIQKVYSHRKKVQEQILQSQALTINVSSQSNSTHESEEDVMMDLTPTNEQHTSADNFVHQHLSPRIDIEMNSS